MTLGPEDRATLLKWARTALEHAARHESWLEAPETSSEALLERRGVFVTLRDGDQLRGCVGNLFPRGTLIEEVGRAAFSASQRDPRFDPVRPQETDRLLIEISVLTRPRVVEVSGEDHALAQMIPHRHGVIIRSGSRIGTFLPKVWDSLPSREAFMAHLKQKAGWAPDEWPADAVMELYEAEEFGEAS